MFDTIWRNVGLAAIQNPHIYGYSIFAYNGQLGLDGGAGNQQMPLIWEHDMVYFMVSLVGLTRVGKVFLRLVQYCNVGDLNILQVFNCVRFIFKLPN